MTNNDETERNKFEAWAKANGLSLPESRWGCYYLADTAWAWRAWQARAKQENNHDTRN